MTQRYALAIPKMCQHMYFEKKVTEIKCLTYCGINELLLEENSF
jgi:hypothetical protein